MLSRVLLHIFVLCCIGLKFDVKRSLSYTSASFQSNFIHHSNVSLARLIQSNILCHSYLLQSSLLYSILSSTHTGLAPELFHELPDLQAAGSLLGDGGFAKRSKLPKRRLEEYDDVRPLVNEKKNILEDNDVSTGVNSTGAVAGLEKWMSEMDPSRHILLRATYNGDEVVLKGFIMGEISQRTGLERELAILSTLRNDCVISPRAVVEDFDMLETTSYVQRVAVFVEYPYYKGTSTTISMS